MVSRCNKRNINKKRSRKNIRGGKPVVNPRVISIEELRKLSDKDLKKRGVDLTNDRIQTKAAVPGWMYKRDYFEYYNGEIRKINQISEERGLISKEYDERIDWANS